MDCLSSEGDGDVAGPRTSLNGCVVLASPRASTVMTVDATTVTEGKGRRLNAAKGARKDEFYTQWPDIEREMNAYIEYDPNVFRDKVVLLPCDDPEWSNFTKFFALHFVDFGIKKLISTSYAPDSNSAGEFYQPTPFETNNPQFDALKTRVNGKRFVLEPTDVNGDGVINIDDLQWEYLGGDGDFRSTEVVDLRDEADIIITNPPFSLLKEFFGWLVDSGKQFAIIANQNAITYSEIFPHIRDNKMWLGKGFPGNAGHFGSPYEDYAVATDRREGLIRVAGVLWFTNIEHGRRHEPMNLMTRADNLKFNKKLIKKLDGASDYVHYDNYDAIEVPFSDAIPSDYDGVMGVPITWLAKYNPDQFEIVGTNRYSTPHGMSQKFVDDYYASGQKGQISAGHPDLCYYDFHGRPVVTYDRILIRHRNANS
jgi:Adenine-specific methyltransferase EcoRI